jgi:riboflavin kinase/FMN adenylyltransferase
VKFAHFDELKAQIRADQARARAYFSVHPAGDGSDDSLPLASAPLAREAVTSDSSAGAPADHDDG